MRTEIASRSRYGPALRAQGRACAEAFAFLTRLPVVRFTAPAPAAIDLTRSAAYFPVVGLVVGLIGGLACFAAAQLWPPVLAVLLSTGVTVLITGAFHEDALADAFDGFGGGWERERILAIMKDSRVGSYALVGMILIIAAKIATLTTIFNAASNGARHSATALDGSLAVARALMAAHVLGRWSSVPLMHRYAYVRPHAPAERPSAGRPFAGGVTRSQVVITSLLTLVLVLGALGSRALVPFVVAAGGTWLAGRYVYGRLGGITGDALGAVNQLVELAVYLVLSARVPLT